MFSLVKTPLLIVAVAAAPHGLKKQKHMGMSEMKKIVHHKAAIYLQTGPDIIPVPECQSGGFDAATCRTKCLAQPETNFDCKEALLDADRFQQMCESGGHAESAACATIIRETDSELGGEVFQEVCVNREWTSMMNTCLAGLDSQVGEVSTAAREAAKAECKNAQGDVGSCTSMNQPEAAPSGPVKAGAFRTSDMFTTLSAMLALKLTFRTC